MVAVATSCVLGLGISFFGLNTRLALSATAFTVLGAACKFLSIFLNMAVWHHHAPHPALPWLLLALSGSLFYQRVT
jgi:GDP-mannose transporter